MKVFILLQLAQTIVLLVSTLLGVAIFTLLERKLLSYLQTRKGPNKVLMSGMAQPFSDALKLLSKSDSCLSWSNKLIYTVSPMVLFMLSLLGWSVIPQKWVIHSNQFSFLLIMIIFGLSVYGTILSGWSSNSKFSLIGGLRAIAQSISYETLMSFSFLSSMVLLSSYSLQYFWSKTPPMLLAQLPVMMVFMIAILAELNRVPFDLSEGESELVGGFTTEYGGSGYVFIFLGEYMFMFMSSWMVSSLYFYKSELLTPLITMVIIIMLTMMRGAYPRMRYDMLMDLCWVYLMPTQLLLVCLTMMVVQTF